jgi:class 3 adenylate cyclase
MDLQAQIELLRTALQQAENIQMELDRRVYYLKTLYDISKDIFGSVEYEQILKNFLMMTMGNFGVVEGFILTVDNPSKKINGFVSVGFQENDNALLKTGASEILLSPDLVKSIQNETDLKNQGLLPPQMICALAFDVDQDSNGLLGLGSKLIGDSYSSDDEELLDTLVNNLVVALKNARSFQEIKGLNLDLQEKNIQLETALVQLKASMRKVELLESIKENLSKFVPITVSRMIEKSPTSIPESKKQDLSVLFLDIEGYTKLTEKLGSSETNEVIEKHFSAFMDAIYANNGDVNETAGDGLMVLFLNEDKQTSALEAVRTALKIRKEAVRIFEECDSLKYRPLDINMGINSGEALVGAAKFETYSGSRWTYTARGSLTNIAARIGAQATRGGIYLSKSTADRIKEHFSPKPKGKFNLKNVSEEIEIFEL